MDINDTVVYAIRDMLEACYKPDPHGVVAKQDLYNSFVVHAVNEQRKYAKGGTQPQIPPAAPVFFAHLPLALALVYPRATHTRARVDGVLGPNGYKGFTDKRPEWEKDNL